MRPVLASNRARSLENPTLCGGSLRRCLPYLRYVSQHVGFCCRFCYFSYPFILFFLTQFLSSNWSNFSFGTKRGLKSQILVEKFAVAKKPAMRTEIITDDLAVCDKITHNAINFGSRMLLSKLLSLGELSRCNMFYD